MKQKNYDYPMLASYEKSNITRLYQVLLMSGKIKEFAP